jgi:predicted RNA-binding Zn-ribbon protein involved in translation (DUF1610 family)
MRQVVRESDSRQLAEYPSAARGEAPVDMRRTIRVQCPKCGEVPMPATEVMLTWDSNDSTGNYAFTCPRCARTYWDLAPTPVAVTLVLAGASLDVRLPPISHLNGIRPIDRRSR